MKQLLHKYGTVVVMGWQDSPVYRLNALVWVLYAVLPSLTFLILWLARYDTGSGAIGGLNLPQMIITTCASPHFRS